MDTNGVFDQFIKREFIYFLKVIFLLINVS